MRSSWHLAALPLTLLAACGGSGVPDSDLGGLVIAQKPVDAPIDVAKAAADPAELGRALMRPFRAEVAALGPHTLAIHTTTEVSGGPPLDDHTTIELGEGSAWHATYASSADYGREVIARGGDLYLRPRYQRWHHRAPESPEEPAAIADGFASAIGATWDLVGPGAELTDGGATQVAGRPARKIGVQLAPQPRGNEAEPLPQRAWRATRTIKALTGEVALDAEKGEPLAVKLDATVGFMRDGKPFELKVHLDSAVTAIGAVAIAAPPEAETVETPERRREVEDRDFLLQGMAPAARSSAAQDVPSGSAGSAGSAASGSAGSGPSGRSVGSAGSAR